MLYDNSIMDLSTSLKNKYIICNIPNNILNMIELDAIILLKITMGWNHVHHEIKIRPLIRNVVQDIFSMDENGNYLDDECGEISYW
jgi:hypothetical protein